MSRARTLGEQAKTLMQAGGEQSGGGTQEGGSVLSCGWGRVHLGVYEVRSD